MTAGWQDQLREVGTAAQGLALAGDAFEADLGKLEDAANAVAQSWSGSNLGYHARVYYAGYTPPPPGARFDSEWGFLGAFQGTTGDWAEVNAEAALKKIRDLAGLPDLEAPRANLPTAQREFEMLKSRAESVLSAFLQFKDDTYLSVMLVKIAELGVPSVPLAVRSLMRMDSQITRDSTALSQGRQPAPHQEVLGEVIALRAPHAAARKLSDLCLRAAEHLDRVASSSRVAGQQVGTKVFIGHGNSLQWRVLKDFISERLNLPWDEFNRVPVAGVTNIQRLTQMLDDAAVALLVLTAEDERQDGATLARQNVVHEAGLFQGRLGFARAIVMLEDGCEEFSNIAGLGQIRYPAGRIDAVFEEVRRVLEREGLVDGT